MSSQLPDPLEQKFAEVEQASERRARQREEPDEKTWLPELNIDPSALRASNRKKRGSISISRLGQLQTDPSADGGERSPRLSSIPALAQYHSSSHHGSRDSFELTDHSEGEDDDHHTTHMETIAGRTTLSKAFGKSAIARRLSRVRSSSHSVLSSPNADNVVQVGVSVQRATETCTVLAPSTAYASGPHLRGQKSMSTFKQPGNAPSSLLSKAKRSIRRRMTVSSTAPPSVGPTHSVQRV